MTASWIIAPEAHEEYADIEQRDPWSVAYLAGNRLPGRATVEGSTQRKIDVKNGPGLDGATMTHQGYEPAEVTITLLMWTEQQWADFERIIPQLQPKPGKPPAFPMGLEHPAAAVMGITRVYVEKVSLPKEGSVPGSREVQISCKQWVKAPAKVVTPKNAGSGLPNTVHDQKAAPYQEQQKSQYRDLNGNPIFGSTAPKPSVFNAGP